MCDSMDEFGVFFRESGAERYSVIVDLAVGAAAPCSHLPNLLRVMVLIPAPQTQREFYDTDSHMGIESDLVAAMSRETGARFVARELTHRQLKFYFYTPLGTKAGPFIVQVLKKYPGFRYRLSTISDPEWTIYFDELYPSRVEFQLMADHGRYMDGGDLLDAPCPICHWIYFSDAAHRERFVSWIQTKGFKFHLCDSGDSQYGNTLSGNSLSSDRPYCVELARADRATHPYLDELVLWLSRQADRFGGEYDSFEAETGHQYSPDLSGALK